ncbi:Gfo/Idh/MocA family protein [uncultured Microbacterium sp.]|uniref:Oxidoreductase domain protein n=1 Tax=uncultured Microbacterium sp. TaxID=191216 RepID=A0A1Y5NY56_9MICO|nr:Gfo/Idh/MocA family oxidoreductase [uncultured Microbacterium sp.]SBS70039.1 Oxidoreductase domain protein [uncultured Microbacterium sp.]
MTGLRWGILATGGIAHAFTSDLRTAGLDVAAVGSRSTDSARAFADQYGIPRAHGSYDDLIADPDVDIIYIATPHSHHLEPAVAALEAGKHVLIEKPVTLDADEATAIRDVAAGHGLLAMEAMWTRYLPHMVRIRELVRAGTLGDIRAVSADHTQRAPLDPAHRMNALELGGGALLDLGIYPVSFAWDVLGAPVEVRALGRLGDTGADTEVAIALTHASGAVSSLLTSSRAVGPNTAQVIGSEARIEIDRVWYTPTSFRLIAPDGTVLEEYRSEVDGRGMQYQALAAEQIVAEGRTDSDLLGFEESIAIMGTLDEVRAQVGVTYPKER